MTDHRLGSSFRDPSGFVFQRDGQILRQVNRSFASEYQAFMSGGLYTTLVDHGRMISHEETDLLLEQEELGWKIVRPHQIPFISYPYEWTFSQLKDAALATLAIQKIAMRHSMSLKDASAFNIQFFKGRPVLIDTLSFEKYEEGEPWVAYRQACEHFLAPLALMAHCDVRLAQLLLPFPDGIPLDLASKLLPRATWLKLGMLVHLHLHARMKNRHANATANPKNRRKIGKNQLVGMIDNLESAIANLRWKPAGTEWADYYQDTNYSQEAMNHKLELVEQFIESVVPNSVWDLGANDGRFSRIAAARNINTVSFDVDPAAVEKNYLAVRSAKEEFLLPLQMNLTTPSPAIGWNLNERMSLIERGPADLVMALALIHHLAISGNIPLGHIARFLHRISRSLIIEFVPKTDSQVQRLLVVRKDIFYNYTLERFEAEFGQFFIVEQRFPIRQTQRVIYLMRARSIT
jgi:hypothetical protein